MIARAVVFFDALVALMGATFQDVAAHLARWGRPELVYLPAALLAAALIAHARVPPRLPENFAWYLILALLAGASLATPWIPWTYVGVAVRPLLLLVIVLVMLRLRPRIGNLYLSGLVPGFLVLIAFTALLYESIPIVTDLRNVGVTHPMVERIPLPMANVAAAGIVVAIFIVASGIRHRPMQLNPSRGWLWAGVVAWVAGAAVSHVRMYLEYAHYALTVAHVLLFIGAFYLLSHLLPGREADRLH